MIVAGYLSGHLDPPTALGLMRGVLTGAPENGGDRVLLQNSCAVFLILAGSKGEALELLANTYSEINKSSEPDEYHRYFIGNNLAALHALRGESPIADRILVECANGLDRMYPAVRETLRRRHELIPSALAKAPHFDVDTFDNYLLTAFPTQLGPQWAFYGRGFLLSDIQFWSFD